jgi:hypothetical protein
MVFLPTTWLNTSLKSKWRPMEFFSRVGEMSNFFYYNCKMDRKIAAMEKTIFQ